MNQKKISSFFVESMTSEQFERISQFANNIPSITSTKTIVLLCEMSDRKRKTFAGIDDFLINLSHDNLTNYYQINF